MSDLLIKVETLQNILISQATNGSESDEEYQKRNIDRNAKENKWIPPTVIKSMIDSFQVPTPEEGFNNIILL